MEKRGAGWYNGGKQGLPPGRGLNVVDGFADGETVDSLDLKGLEIIQPRKGYRFGMDSVLLADFALPVKGERILDLGCGDGVLLFLLWGREPSCTGVGVEIRPDACNRARRSVERNGLSGAFSILEGDLGKIREMGLSGQFSLCVCNPPFWQDRGFRDDGARTQAYCSYEEIAAAAFAALRDRGRFCVICPGENFEGMLSACAARGLALRRFRTVHSRPDAPGKRVLMEFGRQMKHGGTRVLPPIFTNAPAGGDGPGRDRLLPDERDPK